jgi:molecular chaperone DnaK (HSP70)
MIIGIDLGTNNVCISYYHNNKLTIIKDNQDNSFIKSLIAINNSIVVTGNDVLNINDKEWIVIRNLKRLIGMSTENIIVHQKEYSIVELTSFLLSKIKKIIDQHLMSERFPLDYEIILTVPAYFNEKQRQSTKDAFTLSGMKLFRIINEPTSACITYYHYNKNFDKNIMVVDIGAGTTDISILTATKDEDGLDIYEVIATSGDNLLGGEDINNILFEYFGWDKTEDNIKKIEDIKIRLSDTTPTTDKNDLGITTEKYIELLTPLKDRLLNPIKKVIEISNLKREEIDNVILIGGTSKVPFMKKTIEEFYEKEYTYIINPLTAVSFGAALYGNKLLNNQMILMDIVPLSIGVETVGGQFISIIDRGTTIPTNKIKQFTTEADNQTEVIIKIYQGESQFIHENFMIGEFVLKDIPKQPRGVPVINVSISIDLNGLINISATDRKNFSRAELLIENKVKLSDEELEVIVSNKLKNDLLYDDYTTMIDNFYLFRNYYNKINYNTNINCVNKMSDEEKLEITNNINETNAYICSIVNLFENKLKLNVQQYCDSFIEIKETDIKRLNEMIKNKNEEIKTKYEILTLTYNNDSNLLNNEVETQTSIEDNEQKTVTIIERDYVSEFYTLMEQIHSNMNDFQIKDETKLILIEFISNLIVEENSYENKINNLNNFVDKLLNDTTN